MVRKEYRNKLVFYNRENKCCFRSKKEEWNVLSYKDDIKT